MKSVTKRRSFHEKPVSSLAALIAGALVAMLLGGPPLWAQGSASLVGRVVDPSGAIVPQATVTLQNDDSGVSRHTQSNADGNYVIPSLDPGTYTLRASASGFKTYSKLAIALQVGQQARADIQLELGEVAQTTEVTASAPILNTDDATVSQVVENKTATELPINGRDVNSLVSLVPGAIRYGNTFSIGGGRDYSQSVMMDGSDNTFGALGRGIALYTVSPDSIREFRVITNNYSAEYGFGEGGVVLVALRQGSNEFNGTLFEFARNDVFDARNAFSSTKAPLRYNQFGGNLGGPVRRNRTFFFASYEGLRSSTGVTRNQVVPTLEERAGDFSSSGTVIYDPATTVISTSGKASRQPFAGNRIPQSRFDPGGAQLVQLYPAPNMAAATNFRKNTANRGPANSFLGRLDHVLTDAHRISVRYGHTLSKDRPGAVFDPQVDPNSRPQDAQAINASAGLVSILSPALTNDFRFSALRQSQSISHPGNGKGWPSKLGITGALGDVFPIITVTNYAAMGAGNPFRDKAPYSYQIAEGMNWMKGKHLLKFGTDIRLAGAQEYAWRFPAGRFTFNANATRQPGGSGGDSVASLLLGLPVTTELRAHDFPFQYGLKLVSGYFQDDWKIHPRLTLNLGLRYEINTPRRETHDYQNGFDFNRINPVSQTPGVVTFAGVNGWPATLWDTDTNNIAPRFGFAYRPLAGSNTIVRGGLRGVLRPPLERRPHPGNCGVRDECGFPVSR
ncbi:MAG: carboxypeptidase-like regulatory domain-containing protein [Acidobacteria bacterium]|nr:carboxypeptidase-like regulatory domain-containing protein [Acidobacteriota bacterium]